MTTATETESVRARNDRQAGERFRRDTAEHQLTILHDNGLYRHLRFQKPDSSWYRFDLITWPGRLTIDGSMGTFTFAREFDMLECFRDGVVRAQYWQHKIRGDETSAVAYEEELLTEQLEDDLVEYEADYPLRLQRYKRDKAIYYATPYKQRYPWEGKGPREPAELMTPDEVRKLVKDYHEDGSSYHEDGARQLLRELEEAGVVCDTFEWRLKTFTPQYLWCSYAIPWAVAQYDKAKAAASSSPDTPKGADA